MGVPPKMVTRVNVIPRLGSFALNIVLAAVHAVPINNRCRRVGYLANSSSLGSGIAPTAISGDDRISLLRVPSVTPPQQPVPRPSTPGVYNADAVLSHSPELTGTLPCIPVTA